ncbi:hypothetical protein [Nocardiopsis trehalosi]|uniref:hypothetical protein n=1 Tax=Nocardiopsis trehalosi TaxID=109329 RepID=UPI00082F88E5|nr:hypothetical protein [Nocardiopsis trehalosi]
MSEGEEKKKRIDLSVPQVVGGGLATLTAATAASYLGVYGTIIGAAVMSVLSTAGTAVIAHLMARSGDGAKRIAERAQAAPRRRDGAAAEVARSGPAGVDGDTLLAAATEPPADGPGLDATRALPLAGIGAADRIGADSGAADGGTGTPARTGWRKWRRIVIPAAAVFAAAMLVILAFELFTGRSLTATLHGDETRSAPTLLGGQAQDAQEEPVEAPETEAPAPTPDAEPSAPVAPTAPGTGGDAPGGTPAPTAPGTGTTPDPGQDGGPTTDPGTGEDTGDTGEDTDGTGESGTGQDGGAAQQAPRAQNPAE